MVSRPFTTYQPSRKGLSPDSSDPKPPNTEDHNVGSGKQEPAHLSDAEYHEIADQYMNTLQLTLEEVADQDAQKGLEVEYSVQTLRSTMSLCYRAYVLIWCLGWSVDPDAPK